MESIRPRAGNDVADIWPLLMEDEKGNWFGVVNLGNSTAFTICLAWVDKDDEKVLFVGVEEHGAYPFRRFVHWTYVAAKLGLMQGDAMNIADLINRQLGHLDGHAQGEYEKHLLLKD